MKTEHTIVNRVFTKRETPKSDWSGRIGSCELALVSPSKGNVEFHLDGQVLPDQSVLYLMTFSLQSLQDAYAGAASLDEATANWEKKRDALINGTIGARGEGGLSDTERAEIYVAENAIRAKIGADAWKALTDEERVARTESAVEKLRTANADAFNAAVAARVAHVVEQRAKRAAEKAVLGNMSADVDL